MSNKLTSLTGFGEGDPKPERSFGKGKVLYKSKGFDAAEKAHNAKSSALNKKMGKEMKGKGEYSSLKFTARNKKEEGMFNRRFNSKTD